MAAYAMFRPAARDASLYTCLRRAEHVLDWLSMSRVPLPIAATLQSAFAEVLRARVPLARAMLLPGAVIALSSVALHLSARDHAADRTARAAHLLLFSLGKSAVSGLAAVLIAVSCHRLVLLGHDSLPARWGVHWSDREFAFLARAFVLGLLPAMAGGVGYVVSAHMGLDRSTYRDLLFASWPLLAYPTSRLSLVLPATATDQRLTFAQAWRMSSGNGWRLAIVLLTVPLLLTGLAVPLLLTGLRLALRTPYEHPAWVAARSLVFCALSVFEIAALSVSFRALRR
jgi:hypothetical protein